MHARRGLRIWLCVVACVPLLSSCYRIDAESHSGEAFGTYFSVGAKCPGEFEKHEIDSVLARNDQLFSSYRDDSVVSTFNKQRIGESMVVPEEFTELMSVSLAITGETSGQFDIAVAPLVNRFGFGAGSIRSFPSEAEIASLMESVDFSAIDLDISKSTVHKTRQVQIDFGGIAKGFAVDQIAKLLESWGCTDYIVDIGGDLIVKGKNPYGNLWQLAVEAPDGSGGIIDVLGVTDIAVATSGDYRNFRIHDGKRYSHVIDPDTGKPIEHSVASVTVFHSSATHADAYATALLVMGLEDGLAFAEKQNLPAVFLSVDDQRRRFSIKESTAMDDFLVALF